MQSGASCEKLQRVQIMRITLTYCSYIADLTPDFILALAATVPFLQALPLRDALCKHVAFQSSIRVNITVRLFVSTAIQVNSISLLIFAIELVPWIARVSDGFPFAVLRVEKSAIAFYVGPKSSRQASP
jgi:hypothetical protein